MVQQLYYSSSTFAVAQVWVIIAGPAVGATELSDTGQPVGIALLIGLVCTASTIALWRRRSNSRDA